MSSIRNLGAQAGDWCLVRWHEGRTSRVLRERHDGHGLGVDPVTGLAFCGPLSFDDRLYTAGLGALGFPSGKLGNVARFATEEAAREYRDPRHDGSWISLDVPCRLDELHFAVEEYDHYCGITRIFYDGGKLDEARSVLGLRALNIQDEPGSNYLRPEIVCWPLFDRLVHRPSVEQAMRINAVAESLAANR